MIKENSTQQLQSSHDALLKKEKENNGKRIENDKGGKKVVFCKQKVGVFLHLMPNLLAHRCTGQGSGYDY